MSEDFKFYMPIDISKGKNAEGKEVMIVSGVASTLDEDTDGEILDPNGFDMDYFINNGFINWHHGTKENPNSLIGEPLKEGTYVKNNQMHVRAELYPWSPLAKDVYALAENLAKSGSGRKLGWSIEGKATEKNPANAKFISKAKITGCAITPMPKNASTFLDIAKGMKSGMDKGEYNTTESEINGGKITLILDVTRPTGERITVDKDFNVKVTKSLTAGSASGQAISRESLEGAPVILSYDKNLTNMAEIKKAIVIVNQAHNLGYINDKAFNSISNQLKVKKS